jgi:chemotaxis protein MotB
MALARARRRERGVDYWPGFVDALATLLLAIMFLLSVFVLVQFLMSQEITGRDQVLTRLNAQINELTQLLALERSAAQDMEDQLSNLRASLSEAESDRSRLQQLLEQDAGAGSQAQARIGELSSELDDERQIEPARHEPGRTAQPADIGAAQPDRAHWRARSKSRRPATARPTSRSPISAAV